MIEIYSKVRLKSGEIGYIVEVYESSGEYEIELPVKDHDINLRTVSKADIAEVL